LTYVAVVVDYTLTATVDKVEDFALIFMSNVFSGQLGKFIPKIAIFAIFAAVNPHFLKPER